MTAGKTATLAALLALAAPAPAGAAVRVIVPPGHSEADQYYQTVPSATGPQAPDPTRKARDAVREGALSDAAERALRRRGPAGPALATAVARTAPERRGAGGGDLTLPAGAARVSGRAGLGGGLQLMLAAIAAAALSFLLARRRGLVTR